MNKSKLFRTVIFIHIVFFSAELCLGSLHQYIQEYKEVEVTSSQFERIKKYDEFIEYFTSFSYFIPKHKVNPDFIRALILAESNADHRAISNKKALGLGQIIYPTAKQAASELAGSKVEFKYVSKMRLKNLKKDDLFDPAVNILLTCYLIAKYNYKFDGKIELVLSAWNAGEYTKSLSDMQHAPYRETENLIGKVNGYYLYFLQSNNR